MHRICLVMVLGLSSVSFASGGFENLSFTGDGKTPNTLALYEAQSRGFAEPRDLAVADQRGGVSYSIPVLMPPMLLAPQVAIQYSANAGDSVVATGWSLAAGPTIDRIVGPAASLAYGDYQEVFRLSGAGLSGLLLPTPDSFGTEWKIVGDDGAVGVAIRGGKDTWTVRKSGLTYSFRTAHSQYSADRTVRADRWVASLIEDTNGNLLSFEYDDIDHAPAGGELVLRQIAGGTWESPEEVVVAFSYEARPPLVAAARGRVETISRRLQAVEVGTGFGGGGAAQRLELDYVTDGLGEVRLAGAAVVGGSESMTVATFEYADYRPDVPGELDPDLNYTLGSSATSEVLGLARTRTVERFSDISGDGLEDYDASAPNRSRFWHFDPFVKDESIGISFGPSGYSQTVQDLVAVDIDGDGFLDQVTSSIPDGHTYTEFGGSGAFSVRYGKPGSRLTDLGVAEATLSSVPGASTTGRSSIDDPRLPDEARTQQWTHSSLLDIDGDGWADILSTSEDSTAALNPEVHVQYHNGYRGGGWRLPEVLPLDDVRYVAEIEALFDEESGDFTSASKSWSRYAFRDINGDGIVDFVDAREWSLMSPRWRVRLGTGARDAKLALLPAVAWPAPQRELMRALEGLPQGYRCAMSGSQPASVDPSFIEDEGVYLGEGSGDVEVDFGTASSEFDVTFAPRRP